MKHLRLPLKDALADPVDEPMLQRIWQGIESRSDRDRPARTRFALLAAGIGGAVAVAGVCALVVSGLRPGDPGPLLLSDGRQPAAVETAGARAPVAWDLSDGSRLHLAPGGRLEPLENSGSAFAVMLGRGAARFDIRPGGPRRWTIETGLATVEVVGTSFVVERSETRVRIAVERGVVLVRGERVPQRVRRLAAGESIELERLPATQREPPPREVVPGGEPPEPPALAPPSPPPPEEPPAPAAAPAIAPAPATAPGASLRDDRAPRAGARAATPSRDAAAPDGGGGPTTWQDLAEEGQHRAAFSLLGVEGVRRETPRVGVADLLVLADVARLSGHPTEAVSPLERILTEFPTDAHAPLAAFALGRLELDALDRPADAAAAFGRALDLGLPHTLREDVQARIVEAHARAGNAAAAAAAARAYVGAFPHGRHLEAVRRWLEEGK